MAKLNFFNKILNFFAKPNRIAPAPSNVNPPVTKKKYEREDTPQIDTSDASLSSSENSPSASPSSTKTNLDDGASSPNGFRRQR